MFVRGWRLVLLWAWVGVALAGAADERILSFSSDITVHADSTMTVIETIRVRAEGDRIRRGIYRDFPTVYKGPKGERYDVGFEAVAVTRNGQPEMYRAEKQRNGVRVYFGQSDVFLPRGEHTYEFTYRTDHQLGFFDAHDELYWNVTGNGWEFPIDAAEATVHLPEFEGELTVTAYTGPEGAQGGDYRASADPERHEARFATTRPLAAGEGLTIVVAFPKGIVQPPPPRERTLLEKAGIWQETTGRRWLGPVALLGTALVVAWYLLAWVRVGRDPASRVVGVRETPPEGYSPAALHYIANMGFSMETLTAAILSMAQKGYLHIEEYDGRYTLVRDRDGVEGLEPEEVAVARKLLPKSGKITLEQSNHRRLKEARDACHESLKDRFGKGYFHTNQAWLLPGAVLSILAIVGVILLGAPGEQLPVSLFLTVWLSGWTAATWALVAGAVGQWRQVRAAGGVALAIGAVIGSFMALIFLGGEFFALIALGVSATPWAPMVALALVVNYIVFRRLIKSPTVEGRALLDEVEAFRRWLRGDGRFGPRDPEEAARVYDHFLPYAVALGDEADWTERFKKAVTETGSAVDEVPGARPSRHYDNYPRWYHGSRRGVGMPAAFGAVFGSAIASAATAPGSSSGSGGGGSSGGGGGGGGGGGW
jgi:uncharacterized membrane protein YgcG